MNTYDATLNARNGFPVFSTQVEANWLSKSEDKYASFRLTDEDKDEINRLSKDPNIGEHQKPGLADRLFKTKQCRHDTYTLRYASSGSICHACIACCNLRQRCITNSSGRNLCITATKYQQPACDIGATAVTQ